VSTVEKIGRYEIVSELGRGAMGVVYRAVDPNIGRTVALKTMRLDVHGMEHDDMLRRFRNEARAAGLMNHGNIVTIYDAEEIDGLFYIAMEYLEGETLQSVILEKHLIPAEQIVEVAKQVCAGLDYAHQMNVIHRDIKPANIMITRQNVAKIMDFGISKSVGSMTASGQVLGTPNYMSPEQVKGLPLDGRSDLFSFGVMLYEMATGERPFTGQNVTTIIYKIIHETPIAPSELEVSVHPGLSAVITRCIAKDPKERYQTGAEVARDLESFRSIGADGDTTSVLSASGIIPAVPPSPHASGAWLAGATGAHAAATGAHAAAGTAPALSATALETGRQSTSVQSATALEAKPSSKKALGIAFAALAVGIAIAALYGFQHRPQLPPAQETSQASSTAPATPPVSSPIASSASRANPVAAPQASAPEQEAKADKSEPKSSSASSTKKGIVEKIAPAAKVEIRFTSNPEGAFVEFDGKSSAAWTTPFTMDSIAPGTHEVVFTKQGYSVETRSLEIGPKNSSYNMNLVPVMTAVSVTSDPPGASIEIDGKETGKVTPAQIPVAEGGHKIVVHMDGYHSQQTTKEVAKGTVLDFSPVLNPVDARQAGNGNPVTTRLGKFFGKGIPAGKGVIDFGSNPPGARIFIQGRPAAIATPAHAPLPPGDYRIEFREPGYKPKQTTAHVDAGQKTVVYLTLDPQ